MEQVIFEKNIELFGIFLKYPIKVLTMLSISTHACLSHLLVLFLLAATPPWISWCMLRQDITWIFSRIHLSDSLFWWLRCWWCSRKWFELVEEFVLDIVTWRKIVSEPCQGFTRTVDTRTRCEHVLINVVSNRVCSCSSCIILLTSARLTAHTFEHHRTISSTLSKRILSRCKLGWCSQG